MGAAIRALVDVHFGLHSATAPAAKLALGLLAGVLDYSTLIAALRLLAGNPENAEVAPDSSFLSAFLGCPRTDCWRDVPPALLALFSRLPRGQGDAATITPTGPLARSAARSLC